MKTEREEAFAQKIFRTLNFARILFVAFAALAVVACSDDDDDDTGLEFLDGSPTFAVPMYVMTGDTISVTAKGVETEGVEYSWSFVGLDSLSVSGEANETITLLVPDTLGTFDITVTASAGDYYYTSFYTGSVTTVGEGSLLGVAEPTGVIVDERDSREYGYTRIGNLEWFTQNLNWNGAGAGYAKSEAAAYVLGRLYTWNDATGGVSASGLGAGVQGVCPKGWSVPTNEDWEDLALAIAGEQLSFAKDWKGVAGKLMAPATFNGEKVWPYSPQVDITNDYGWNALAGGTALNTYTQFSNIFKYGFWWSGTQKDSNNAHYRYIYSEYPNFCVNYAAKDGMAASVRCVRIAK